MTYLGHGGEEDVSSRQVSMHNLLLFHVLHAQSYLGGPELEIVNSDFNGRLQEFVEYRAYHELLDHHETLIVLGKSVHLEDAGMVEGAHDIGFAKEISSGRAIFELLDRHLFLRITEVFG